MEGSHKLRIQTQEDFRSKNNMNPDYIQNLFGKNKNSFS